MMSKIGSSRAHIHQLVAMKLSSLLAFLELSVVVSSATVSFPAKLYDGPVRAGFVSVEGNLDGPKLSPGPANKTSFDW